MNPRGKEFAVELLSRLARGTASTPAEIELLIAVAFEEFTSAIAIESVAPSLLWDDKKKIPPSPESVASYSASIGWELEGQAWCDFYAAKGWMAGRTKMKDWQAAVRNWKSSGWKTGPKGGSATAPAKPRRTFR